MPENAAPTELQLQYEGVVHEPLLFDKEIVASTVPVPFEPLQICTVSFWPDWNPAVKKKLIPPEKPGVTFIVPMAVEPTVPFMKIAGIPFGVSRGNLPRTSVVEGAQPEEIRREGDSVVGRAGEAAAVIETPHWLQIAETLKGQELPGTGEGCGRQQNQSRQEDGRKMDRGMTNLLCNRTEKPRNDRQRIKSSIVGQVLQRDHANMNSVLILWTTVGKSARLPRGLCRAFERVGPYRCPRSLR